MLWKFHKLLQFFLCPTPSGRDSLTVLKLNISTSCPYCHDNIFLYLSSLSQYHCRPNNFIYLCPYHPSSHSLMLKTLVCKGGFDGEVWANAGHCKNIKIVAINRVK